MNNFIVLILIAGFLFLSGCATTADLQDTEKRFGAEISALKEEDANLRKDIAKKDQSMNDMRKRIADVAADTTAIREDMENLRGDREVLGKRETDLKKEFADMRNQYDQLSSRIKVMESLLEIGTSAGQSPSGEKAAGSVEPGKTDEESAYDSAYDEFKKERYEKAREGFENYLKKYPNTKYSDSAQFWIGECYYFQRKYEQAILEYEKVIKNYPQGNKVPSALLKQGFAFLNIGDKSSARVLLEQVVKDYPATNQARTAKAKLAEIK